MFSTYVKYIKAVRGDKEAEMELLASERFGDLHARVLLMSRTMFSPFMGRVPANVEVAVAAITILVTLFIGILIMTQVKGTATTIAQQNNDTAALDMLNNVFNTGSAGLVILALSVLVLGAAVIIGYLRNVGGGR
ncbi:hypothetical protein [Methanocaldococcus sp.]